MSAPFSDPTEVSEQYFTEERLAVRQSVWHPTADGREPATEALYTIVDTGPGAVLEIGCGTGAFASRLASALPDADVVALDQSKRMVELTAGRGVEARVGDAHDLPFADDTFDAVAAMWMLYHVTDLHRGLDEVRRVLRPGGTFVAVTNGIEHIAGLRREAGGEAVATHFSSENGEAALLQHFDVVRRDDLRTRAILHDRDAALAYLRSSEEDLDWDPPLDGWPREYAGHVTIFAAS